MNPRNSILLLRQYFTPDDFRLCLPALRQEPLVWKYLTSSGKIEKAVEMLTQDPQDWTPAALALLELDNPISIKNLRDPDWVALEPELHERASTTLEFLRETASSSTSANLTLESAALAALALRELSVFHGNWSFLPEFTNQTTAFSRPVMACLVGMVPDKDVLIETLLTIQPSTAVHAFLCIPASLDDQCQQLNKMISDLDEGIKTEILLSLASGPGCRPELAKRLTIDRNEPQDKIASPNESWFYPAGQVESDLVSISHLYNNGRTFDACGKPQAALDQYRLALQATQKLEGYFLSKCAEAYQETAESIALSVQAVNKTALNGEDQQISKPEPEDETAVLLQAQDYTSAALQSWEQAQQLDPDQFSYIVNYADYLIDQKRLTDAEAALNRLNKSEFSTAAEAPFSYWAVATRLSTAQDKPDQSQVMLHNAIEQLETFEDDRVDFPYSQLHVDLLAKLAKTALDLHSYKNAEKLVNHLVKIYPVDAKTLALQAETQLAQGKATQALESAQIAYTLEPDSAKYLLFIETLEAAGEWALALEERQSVIETTTEPKPMQYHQLATCAIQAGQPEVAAFACQKALDINPQDGRALTLLGEIALSESQPDQALDYFEQAVLLSPEIDETWLNLANWYTIHNQPNHSLQTLQQAAQAAGESIEIQLALGKAYLEESSPSLALSPLRQASELIKSIRLNILNWQKYQKLHIAITYSLAKTLYQLGYQDESRRAFETVCKGDPYELRVEPQIAHDYAQVLLNQGETDAAIPWLNYASEKSANPIIHVALAKALLAGIKDEIGQTYLSLGDNQETLIVLAQKAADLLNKALENPGRMDANEIAQAYALLAEAYQTIGNLPGAMDAYRRALESNLAQQDAWHFRLSFGLGKVASSLGEYETAIAALLEAREIAPKNPLVTRSLAEAYRAIDLPADVYQAAMDTVTLDPENPATLLWFAEQCLGLIDGMSGDHINSKNRPVVGKSHSWIIAALHALQKAITISPERGYLIVRLAEVQVLNGERQAALETLEKLDADCCANWESGLLTSNDLSRAANLLTQLEEIPQAVEFLDRAVQLHKVEAPQGEEKIQAELNFELAQALYKNQNLSGGLAAVEEAVCLDPDNINYYYLQTLLLLSAQESLQAAACLEKAQIRWPESWEIALRLALIFYEQGQLTAAGSHLQNACSLLSQQAPGSKEEGLCLWLAAEIAHSLLSDDAIEQDSPKKPVSVVTFEYACLQAERALRESSLEAASENATVALAPIVEVAPHHPRLLALQARLVARQEGVSETSLQLFNTSLEDLNLEQSQNLSDPSVQQENGKSNHQDQDADFKVDDLVSKVPNDFEPYYQQVLQNIARLATLKGIIETALELKQWIPIENLIEMLVKTGPASPLKSILRVRWIIQRAEMQQICEGLDIIQHSPGTRAKGEEVRRDYECNLLAAADQIEIESKSSVSEINRWRVRGAAIFSPDNDQLTAFKLYAENNDLTVEDEAGFIRLLGQLDQNEEALAYGSELAVNPLTSVVLGLVIQKVEPERTLNLVQQTIEQLSRPELSIPDALPMLLALKARTSAALPSKQHEALQAIQQALSIWPDEARWHELAAELMLLETSSESYSTEEDKVISEVRKDGHSQETISIDPVAEHLEIAARLEPGLAEHHLKLGEYYAQKGEIVLALEAVEQATSVEPERADAWLALAVLQKETGQIEKAITSVERALAFANQSLEALLLRAELALLNNNPRGAFSRAQTVINTTPDRPEAWFIMAQALEMLDQPEDALKAANRAIDCTEEIEETTAMQELRIRLIYRIHGPKTAIQAIQLLDQANPESAQDPYLKTYMADYSLEIGEIDPALQAARAALQVGQTSLPAETQGHLHYLIGAQMRRQGQLDQAIYHLNEAIQKSPSNFSAYLELGGTYQDRRQINQALEVYQMAAKRMPNDYRSYYQSGLALKDSKDYIEAENMFRRAAHLAPNEVSVHRQLAAVVALNLVHNRRVASTD